MKAKRKVHLSGSRWHPVRSFEFSTHQSVDEVIATIKSLEEDGWFIKRTRVTFKRKDEDGQHSFRLRSRIGRNMNVIIEGAVAQSLTGVSIKGKAQAMSLTRIAFILIFQLVILIVSVLFYGFMLEASLPTLIFLAFYLFAWVMIYSWAISQREEMFNKLLEAMLPEETKVKRGDGA